MFDNEAFLGASNLYFPAHDLARWANAWALDAALPADVVRAGQERPRIAGLPSAIDGLSWYGDATGDRCHYGGSINAFHSLVYWDRARRESVVLVTSSSMPACTFVTRQRALIAALRDTDSPVEPPPAITDRAATPDAARGVFASADGSSVVVDTGPDGLRVRVDCGLVYDAFPVGDGVFYVPGTDDVIALSGDEGSLVLHRRSVFTDVALPRRDADPRAAGCRD